jgi:Family of unknown function (DUF6338)
MSAGRAGCAAIPFCQLSPNNSVSFAVERFILPTSVSAILVIVAFLMPGFVANRILALAHSRPESNDSRLILEAVTLSSVNYAMLSWLLVLFWTHRWYETTAYFGGLVVLVLFVFPIVIALGLVKTIDSKWGHRIRANLKITHPVPSAWDCFFRESIPCRVVAKLKSGGVVAGLYGSKSWASSAPAEQDIYLEKLCSLSPDGKMEKVRDGSLGGIIRMDEVEVLELFEVKI